MQCLLNVCKCCQLTDVSGQCLGGLSAVIIIITQLKDQQAIMKLHFILPVLYVFLQLAFQNLYSASSGYDKCTLYADRTLINRQNVKSDVSSAVNPCRQFFTLEVHARVIAATLKVLNMANLEEEPGIPFPGDESSKEDKKNYLEFVCAKVVDMFVIDESKNERILECLDSINLCEKAKALSLDDNNRYQCRYEGCQKSFAKYGKRMKDHEANQ